MFEMFQDFSAWLYQLLHGIQEPEYEQSVYQQALAALLFWSLVGTAVYYYVIGWVTSEFNMTRHWFLTLVVTCLICMATVVVPVRFAFETWYVPATGYSLALIQGLYTAVLFVLLSLAIKWGSPNARRTPV
jgi:hypothetical protein